MFDFGSAQRLAAALTPHPRRPLPVGLVPRDGGARLELAELATAFPKPEHAGRLVALGAALTDRASQLKLLAVWERYAGWVSAQQQTTLAAVAGDDPMTAADGSSSDDWTREDVGCALRLSPAAAHRRIALARRLAGALRPARDALGRGELTFLHTLNLAEQVANLADPAARAVCAAVLPGAAETSLGAFRKKVTRAIAEADPTAWEGAAARSHRERRVELWPGTQGDAVLAATGSAVDAEVIYTALSTAARAAQAAHRTSGTDEPRPTLATLRYDTLLGWARTSLVSAGRDDIGDVPGRSGNGGEGEQVGSASGATSGEDSDAGQHSYPGTGRAGSATGASPRYGRGDSDGPVLDIQVTIDPHPARPRRPPR